MTFWLSNLASVLRNAGLYVVEVPGWQTRSFPTWSPPGYIEPPTHVMIHHTASNTSVASDIDYILNGPISPICNIYLGRNGACHVIAAGRVATNGKGSSRPWNGGVPDNTMNHFAISIEAANNGIGEPWPQVQTDAYVKLAAALCVAYNIPVDHVRGHCEWAPGRKIDPAGPSPWAQSGTWNMAQFRNSVAHAIDSSIVVKDNMKLLNPSQRVLDTRTLNKPLLANETRVIAIPTTDPAAFVNLCVTGATHNGYLTAWGAGTKPATSAVNYSAGQTVANSIVVPVTNGHISVCASQQVHLIVDLYATWPTAGV